MVGNAQERDAETEKAQILYGMDLGAAAPPPADDGEGDDVLNEKEKRRNNELC